VQAADPAGDPQGLGGVGEVQASHGGDLQLAKLHAAVAAVAGVVGDRDVAPGQGGQLVVQGGLVGLDDQDVGGVLSVDQPVGVLALGVHGVGGHHPSGKVQALQQGPELGDLVAGGVHVGLGQDRTAGVVHRGEQVDRRALVVAAAAQGLAVDRDPCRHGRGVGGGGGLAAGGCWLASQAPIARSSASASMRARTRRTVASPGGLKARVRRSRRTPSAASTWPGASAAHSPIAARELAPVSTATTATASTVANACRRPRRWRGRRSGRGGRAGHGTARVPARRVGPPDGWQQGWGMMQGQARSPGGSWLRQPT
jgi:hypothetical protein